MFETLSRHLTQIQVVLFPLLRVEVGPATDVHMKIVAILETIKLEQFLDLLPCRGEVGRPRSDRRAVARAFVAKAVLNLSTTRQLLDRLSIDMVLRRICGWERRDELPSESVFSRAFAEFAQSELPARIHGALITKALCKNKLPGSSSRCSKSLDFAEFSRTLSHLSSSKLILHSA